MKAHEMAKVIFEGVKSLKPKEDRTLIAIAGPPGSGKSTVAEIVTDLMNKNPKVLSEETLAFHALGVMKKNNISQVLVTDPNNTYIGIVHILDIIKQGINDE